MVVNIIKSVFVVIVVSHEILPGTILVTTDSLTLKEANHGIKGSYSTNSRV